MKKYTLATIKKLAKESMSAGPTGNALLDSKYDHYVKLVGHEVPYYRLFYKLAQELKPSFVVELGSYRGTAAAHFAVGNPQAKVVTIDIHKDLPGQQPDKDATIEVANKLNNVEYVNKWSWDAVGDVKSYKQPIDILFIDAWHREDLVKREWDLYSPLLAEGALVICDDILNAGGIFEGMEEWWDSFPYEKFIDDGVHAGVPMGFFQYVSKNKSTVSKPKKVSKGKVGTTKLR